MDLQLTYSDGRKRVLTLPEQFATKFVEFDGRKFEKQDTESGLDYSEVGKAPHTTLHGGKSKGTATLGNKKRGVK